MRNRTRLFPVLRSYTRLFPRRHWKPSSHCRPTWWVCLDYDYIGTIEQALRWHPAARRLVDRVRYLEPRSWMGGSAARRNSSRSGGVTVEYLSGLPTASVLKRLGELGPDAVVFTPFITIMAKADSSIPAIASALWPRPRPLRYTDR